MISHRPNNPEVTYPETYDQIRQWLKECHEEHTTSCYSQYQELKRPPSHLIDVSIAGQTQNIRLVKTTNLSAEAEYAALSYCVRKKTSPGWHSNTDSVFNISGEKIKARKRRL